MPASRLLTALVVALSIVSGLGLISAQTPTFDDAPIAAGTAESGAVRPDASSATPPDAGEAPAAQGRPS